MFKKLFRKKKYKPSNESIDGFKLRAPISSHPDKTLIDDYLKSNIKLFPLGKLVERQNEKLAIAFESFFSKFDKNFESRPGYLSNDIREFRKIFLSSPFGENHGGANFSTSLILYLSARMLNPDLIVESGVYRGASSYFLRAACPKAEIYAFDTNLKNLVYRSSDVNYIEADWMSENIRCLPSRKGLLYLDDHQDQSLRILQSHERGFRHLLLDDCWPIDVPGCGWPPIPTVDMIVDNWLEIGEEFNWVENELLWTYKHTHEAELNMQKAYKLIGNVVEWPLLYRETGIAPTSTGKYVELVP